MNKSIMLGTPLAMLFGHVNASTINNNECTPWLERDSIHQAWCVVFVFVFSKNLLRNQQTPCPWHSLDNRAYISTPLSLYHPATTSNLHRGYHHLLVIYWNGSSKLAHASGSKPNVYSRPHLQIKEACKKDKWLLCIFTNRFSSLFSTFKS